MTSWNGREAWWTGDEWRWGLQGSSGHPSITVIEPPDSKDPPKRKANVPFGFSRALPRVDAEPLLWEGDGA